MKKIIRERWAKGLAEETAATATATSDHGGNSLHSLVPLTPQMPSSNQFSSGYRPHFDALPSSTVPSRYQGDQELQSGGGEYHGNLAPPTFPPQSPMSYGHSGHGNALGNEILLEDLPRELLILVIEKLSVADCFSLRKCCRRFYSLTNSVVVLPSNPDYISVDFPSQVLVISPAENKWQKIAVVNGNVDGSEQRGPKTSSHLDDRFSVFFNVGNTWTDYLRKYVLKLNKSQQIFEGTFTVMHIPDTLLLLSIGFDVISIEPRCQDKFSPLPLELDRWLSNRVLSDSMCIHFTFSPSQLDRVLIGNFRSLLDDEGAVHMLDKFENGTLPEELNIWTFDIDKNAGNFWERMASSYGLHRETFTSSFGVSDGRYQLVVTRGHNGGDYHMLITCWFF